MEDFLKDLTAEELEDMTEDGLWAAYEFYLELSSDN